MKEIEKIFRSRISVLLIAPLVILIPVSIPLFQNQAYHGLYILGGLVLLIVSLFSCLRYVISDGKLYIKMGSLSFGSEHIADILLIERSYNPLSSPAASLKRLRIFLKRGVKYPSYTLISPAKEKEFIEELKAINPNIQVNVPEKKGVWRIWDWDI